LAVLAIILGLLFETSMRQSLLMFQGSFLIFFNCLIDTGIMIGAITWLVWPLINAVRSRFNQVSKRDTSA